MCGGRVQLQVVKAAAMCGGGCQACPSESEASSTSSTSEKTSSMKAAVSVVCPAIELSILASLSSLIEMPTCEVRVRVRVVGLWFGLGIELGHGLGLLGFGRLDRDDHHGVRVGLGLGFGLIGLGLKR